VKYSLNQFCPRRLVPLWLVCFSDAIKGSMRQMFFVVLLADGTVVEPRVEKRL
jgi:hypothetical protein